MEDQPVGHVVHVIYELYLGMTCFLHVHVEIHLSKDGGSTVNVNGRADGHPLRRNTREQMQIISLLPNHHVTQEDAKLGGECAVRGEVSCEVAGAPRPNSKFEAGV